MRIAILTLSALMLIACNKKQVEEELSSTPDGDNPPQTTPAPPPDPGPPPVGSPTPPPIPDPDPNDDPGRGYFYATASGKKLERTARTHLLIATSDEADGPLWQEAARGRARRIERLYPEDQVVLIFRNELGLEKHKAMLEKWGLHPTHVNKSLEKSVVDEISGFSKIASLDLFVPSNGDSIWGLEMTDDLTSLSPQFTRDSVVHLHGPHAGWIAASRLSDLWAVPVIGALSEVRFERLTTDGIFRDIHTEEPDLEWAFYNDISFERRTPCAHGACIRLKPTGWPSPGVKTALSFYKGFCAHNRASDCRKRLAHARFADLTAWKNDGFPDAQAFTDAMKDFFCPDEGFAPLKADCGRKLEHALSVSDVLWNPLTREQPACTVKGCSPSPLGKSTTTYDELEALLVGFDGKD